MPVSRIPVYFAHKIIMSGIDASSIDNNEYDETIECECGTSSSAEQEYECGTSLAERAFENTLCPLVRTESSSARIRNTTITSSSSSSSSSPPSSSTDKEAVTSSNAIQCHSSFSTESRSPLMQDIDALRSFIADQIVQDHCDKNNQCRSSCGGTITTFLSPFEVPTMDALEAAERRRIKYGHEAVISLSDITKQSVSKSPSDPKGTNTKISCASSIQFLRVPLIYCDHTASNRPISSIEQYIQQTCLPFYGNTHTNITITGSQSTAFVAEARQIVAEETNAKITGKAALDVVLFA
jgi:hypothetical protein